MSDERVGSWEFKTEFFDEFRSEEILDSDLQHITEMIKEGFTSGDIIH